MQNTLLLRPQRDHSERVHAADVFHHQSQRRAGVTAGLSGPHLRVRRAYVFEIDADERVDNTYEWCAPGVEPQKDILQKVPLSSIDWRMQVFPAMR